MVSSSWGPWGFIALIIYNIIIHRSYIHHIVHLDPPPGSFQTNTKTPACWRQLSFSIPSSKTSKTFFPAPNLPQPNHNPYLFHPFPPQTRHRPARLLRIRAPGDPPGGARTRPTTPIRTAREAPQDVLQPGSLLAWWVFFNGFLIRNYKTPPANWIENCFCCCWLHLLLGVLLLLVLQIPLLLTSHPTGVSFCNGFTWTHCTVTSARWGKNSVGHRSDSFPRRFLKAKEIKTVSVGYLDGLTPCWAWLLF